MEIKTNDILAVKAKALRPYTVRSKNGTVGMVQVEINQQTFKLPVSQVHSVLERAETDAEKIARLEARVAELEEQNGELAQGQLSRYRQRFPSMAEAWPEQKPEEKVIPAANKSRWDFCSGKKKKPWYPPQPRGFGPWIEGRVPEDVLRKGAFQILYRDERREKTYTALNYSMGGFVVSKPENVVAYCLKED